MALRGIANQSNTTTSTTCVVTVSGIGGSGPQLNDIILLMINGGGGGTNTITFPSGFNTITGLTNINIGAGTDTMAIVYKIGTASEPATYTVTSSANDFQTVQCRCYSGRNTTSTFSATAQTNSTAAGNTPLTCAITGLTAVANDDIVLLMGNSNNNTVAASGCGLTVPSGWANESTGFGAVAFSTPVYGCDFVNNSGGATGTLAPVITASTLYSVNAYAGYVISLAQGSVGPPPSPLFYNRKNVLYFIN